MVAWIRRVLFRVVVVTLCVSLAWLIMCQPIGWLPSPGVGDETCTVVGRIVERSASAYAIEDPTGLTWVLADDPLRPGAIAIVHGGVSVTSQGLVIHEQWRFAAGH